MSDRPVAWVLGAAGFLGRYVAKTFHRAGWLVAGASRTAFPEAQAWGIDAWRIGDVGEEFLQGLLATSGRPDLIFHSAGAPSVSRAETDPRRAFSDTVQSAFETVEFARHSAPDALLIYPSSCAVYGIRDEEPIPESAPLSPISVYGVHKAMAEQVWQGAARHSGLRAVVVRFFSLYGPHLRKQLMWDVCLRALRGDSTLEFGGTGSETRDFLHVQDAAQLILDVAVNASHDRAVLYPTVLNGGSGRATSTRLVVEMLLNCLGVSAEVVFSGQRRVGDPPHYRADIMAASSLGFAPTVSLERGIATYCAWARDAAAVDAR